MSEVDLSFLPEDVRNAARLVTGGNEVMWHRTEAIWGPSTRADRTNPASARSAALEELQLMSEAGLADHDWVVVTW